MRARVAVSREKCLAREYAEAFIGAFIYALIVLTFLVRPFKIPSGSMRPTLEVGDRILVNRFGYRVGSPGRGDIAVFIYPRENEIDYVKRVIGLPGDAVEIVDEHVYVNGDRLEGEKFQEREYYRRGEWSGPLVVPEGSLFVLGDNSANSKDSRYWGFVPVENLKGKAFAIYWPPRRVSRLL